MATICDLNDSEGLPSTVRCDVCIIGAGAAGLYLANRLSSGGLNVILLEAGGASCSPGAKVGIDAVFAGSRYAGALEGRAFGLGGTTSSWGGLLAPHSDLDLRDGRGLEAEAWEKTVRDVRQNSGAVFSALGLGRDVDFLELPSLHRCKVVESLRRTGLETLATEFLPFWRRNLTYLLRGSGSRKVEVYLNSVAAEWTFDGGAEGRVASVEVRSPTGRKLRVEADNYVVAAGAIESTRILLEINRATEQRLLPHSARTGQCLSDHLSCAIANVAPEDRMTAARLFGPIFIRRRMRSFRFVERSVDSLVPRHFAHFIFDIQNPGFDLARTLLSSLQARTAPRIGMTEIIKGVSGLSKLAYARLLRSRLFISERTAAHLQLDIEQHPAAENRVYLGDELDRHGRPVAVIDWSITPLDYVRIEELSRRLLLKWPGPELGLPALIPTEQKGAEAKPYDAYHPVGTCRMGSDNEATVDLTLRVQGTENLYVLSTAVFPSAGTANPTFSMLCLGETLAQKFTNLHAA